MGFDDDFRSASEPFAGCDDFGLRQGEEGGGSTSTAKTAQCQAF